MQYAYDAAGNRASLINSGNVTFTYAYDAANCWTQITQGSRTWSFGYDAAGNRTSLNHPNGAKIAYSHLNHDWLGTVTHKRSGNVTFDTFTYAYDANGDRTTLTDYTGTTAFGYDALNRLTGAAYPGTCGTWSCGTTNRPMMPSPASPRRGALQMRQSKLEVDGEERSVGLPGKSTGSSGLTLIESLVALGLLALVVAGAFGAYMVGVDAGRRAQQLAVMAALGQARLEVIRSDPLQTVEGAGGPAPLSGVHGVVEQIEVHSVSSDVNQVTVTLLWNWRGQQRQTVLTTLVRQPSAK